MRQLGGRPQDTRCTLFVLRITLAATMSCSKPRVLTPTVFSYIVGDVTIKLARMLAQAETGQVLIGDFNAALPDRPGLSDANGIVRAAIDELKELPKLNIAGSPLQEFVLQPGSCGSSAPRAQRIVDKHGLEQKATNLEFSVRNGDETMLLGVPTQ